MTGKVPVSLRARATCPHGLRYDPDTSSGCAICRRERGEPDPASGGGAGAWAGIGTVAALVALAAFAWSRAHRAPEPAAPEGATSAVATPDATLAPAPSTAFVPEPREPVAPASAETKRLLELAQSCELHPGRACADLGVACLAGAGHREDILAAGGEGACATSWATRFRQACAAGDWLGCSRIDPSKRPAGDAWLAMLRTACETSYEAAACAELAREAEGSDAVRAAAWRRFGEDLARCGGKPCAPGDTVDTHLAEENRRIAAEAIAADRALFEARTGACTGGDQTACTAAASMLADGRGTAKDAARAAQLWQQACLARQPAACFLHGLALAAGEGVASDMNRARAELARFVDLADGACRHEATQGPTDCARVVASARRARPLQPGTLKLGGTDGDACRAGDTLACLRVRGAF